MFTGFRRRELSEIKEMDISQEIKTIVASRSEGYCNTQNLEFRNQNGQFVGFTGIFEEDKSEDGLNKRQLEEGEQIIGLYGHKGEECNSVNCIGFIVWKPPKL